jgi:predicted nucleic acid-binding protein
VTIFEAIYGLRKECDKQGNLDQVTQQDLRNIQNLAASCPILDFNYTAAEIAAFVCGRLSKNMSKDLMRDIFIASIAIAHGYGIATWNRKDFKLIAENLSPDYSVLRIATWNR